jgi:hypothetical protein
VIECLPGVSLYFLFLGFVNVGGPVAQITIMYNHMVEKRQWLTKDRFVKIMAFCHMLARSRSAAVGNLCWLSQAQAVGWNPGWSQDSGITCGCECSRSRRNRGRVFGVDS